MLEVNTYEIRTKVYVLKDLLLQDSIEQVANLCDLALVKDKKMEILHNEKTIKPYVVGNIYNCGSEINIIKTGDVVEFIVRTISEEIRDILIKYLPNVNNSYFKAIISECSVIDRMNYNIVRTITPINTNFDNKYWRDADVREEELIVEIINNLSRKFSLFTGIYLGQFNAETIYTLIESYRFIKDFPVYTKYKGIKLKGDLIEFKVQNNRVAQELFYLGLGCGLGLKCGRGFGCINVK